MSNNQEITTLLFYYISFVHSICYNSDYIHCVVQFLLVCVQDAALPLTTWFLSVMLLCFCLRVDLASVWNATLLRLRGYLAYVWNATLLLSKRLYSLFLRGYLACVWNAFLILSKRLPGLCLECYFVSV